MKDFASAWEAMTSEEDPDPKVQKERELQRLYMLTTAAATQALWNAAKSRILFMLFGFIFVPPLAFHGAMTALDGALSEMFVALIAIAAWIASGVVVFYLARYFVDGDPDKELAKTSEALLIADDAFRAKWGQPKRKPSAKPTS